MVSQFAEGEGYAGRLRRLKPGPCRAARARQGLSSELIVNFAIGCCNMQTKIAAILTDFLQHIVIVNLFLLAQGLLYFTHKF
jgi:hypothetical protein